MSITEARLGDIAEVFSGALPGKKEGATEEIYPVINIKNLDGGTVDASTLEKESFPGVKNINQYQVQEGDLLVSIRGTVTKAALVPTSCTKAVIKSNLAVIRNLDTNVLLPSILNAYLNSELGRQALESLAGGATILHINIRQLRELKVPVPPMNEQKQLEKLLASYDEYRATTLRELELKTAITNHLMLNSFIQAGCA